MKEKYFEPTITVINFNMVDIMTTSIPGEIPDDDNDVAWGE